MEQGEQNPLLICYRTCLDNDLKDVQVEVNYLTQLAPRFLHCGSYLEAMAFEEPPRTKTLLKRTQHGVEQEKSAKAHPNRLIQDGVNFFHASIEIGDCLKDHGVSSCLPIPAASQNPDLLDVYKANEAQ